MIVNVLGAIYIIAVAGIAVFGMLGLATIWFYWRHRNDRYPRPVVGIDELPSVTVQLPIYNERLVVNRLIEAAVKMEYPRDRLHIQVLDDSTDETTLIAAGLVEIHRAQGIDIELIHRTTRVGFKAGALADGLDLAKGEFIVVFDADFEPLPGFLGDTIPHFIGDPSLGMIQTRWGHLNEQESALTAAQSIALDKHFALEQNVRHRANLFPKFNGSAGVWRRQCLIDAGGWEDDTVCEDLCLSTRAVLKGWRFRYLNGVVAPAELPGSITAYKNQQSRWAKGSTQCLLKFGPSILTARNQPPAARIYALISMAGYSTHLLMLVLLLLQVPLIYYGYRPPPILLLLGIASIAQPLLFVSGQQMLYSDWLKRLRFLPSLLLVAIGLAPSNSRAIFEAVVGQRNDFVRTPKGKTSPFINHNSGSLLAGYKMDFDWIIIIELLLAGYAFVGILISLDKANYWPVLFMTACMLGFGYVALASLRDRFSRAASRERAPQNQASTVPLP